MTNKRKLNDVCQEPPTQCIDSNKYKIYKKDRPIDKSYSIFQLKKDVIALLTSKSSVEKCIQIDEQGRNILTITGSSGRKSTFVLNSKKVSIGDLSVLEEDASKNVLYNFADVDAVLYGHTKNEAETVLSAIFDKELIKEYSELFDYVESMVHCFARKLVR
ncbi:hypothetical protein ACOME3_002335 [Neoechinorhynchus agilis]